MKINIAVEVDWLGEDGNIDEEMQKSIINGVKNSIGRQCLDRVEKKASEAIDKAIKDAVAAATESVGNKVSEFVENWMKTEVVLTDKYGDVTEKGSIRDLVKKQFDGLMNDFVNSEGKIVGRNGYGAQMSVVKFLTGQAVTEVVAAELVGYKKDIDNKIKAEINNGIKNNVSDLFAQMVVNTAQQRHAEMRAIEATN